MMPRRLQAALGILGVVAALVVIFCTPGGMATTSDSVNYVMAARTLVAGEGLIACIGEPYVRFPPLYPVLLAIPGVVGVDAFVASRWINALTFGLTVFAAGQLFWQSTRSVVFTVLGAISTLISWALLIAAIFTLTEPLFSLLAVVAALVTMTFLRERSWRTLMVLAAVVGLAWLQRYVGFALVGAVGVAILLLLHGEKWITRLKYAVVFGVVASLPLGLWLLRNWLVAGTVAGGRGQPNNDLWRFSDVIVQWFVPGADVRVLVVVGLVVIIAAAVLWVAYRHKLSLEQILPPVPTVFLVVILVSFAAVNNIMDVTIDNRMLSPLFVFLMVVVISLAAQVARWLDTHHLRGTWIIGGLVLLSLLPSAQKFASELQILAEGDAIGFGSTELRESAQVEWVRAHSDQTILSNWPHPICLNANYHTARIAHDDPAATIAILEEQLPAVVVVFDTDDRRYRMQYEIMDELSQAFTVEPLLETDNGGVYQIGQ